MRTARVARGYALLLAVIIILVVTVASVAVIRFASREVAGANAGRKFSAVANCTEAARAMLMGQWKLLGTHDVGISPLKVTLESVTPTTVQGGHYGQDPTSAAYWNKTSGTWISNVQVTPLNPLTVGSKYQVSDLTNRIGDTVAPYRVVVHCVQGSGNDARELELEFAVQYGL